MIHVHRPLQVIRRHAACAERAQAWYKYSSVPGLAESGRAGRALAEFSLANRSTCWHLLSWQRHSHAPAIVANKLAYFAELQVAETIQAFLDHCPMFWASERLQTACSCAGWVKTDLGFFEAVCASMLLMQHWACDSLCD